MRLYIHHGYTFAQYFPWVKLYTSRDCKSCLQTPRSAKRRTTESHRSPSDKKQKTTSPIDRTAPTKTSLPTDSEKALPGLLIMSGSLTLSESGDLPSPKGPRLRKISPVPHLNTADPLIKELGLEWLNNEGYINLASISIPDPDFGYGKHKTPAVAYRTYKRTGIIDVGGKKVNVVKEDLYIHPVFFRDRWETQELASSSSPHWEALKPVWQLATLLLEEKVMSGYMIGMLDRSSHTEIKTRLDGHQVYWFQCKEKRRRR